MAQKKADFIKVPTGPSGFQTMPVEPDKRLPDSEISIRMCNEGDAEKIAEGLYVCFPEDWWAAKEPLELRPPQQITRVQRLAKRLRPSLTTPYMNWVKAVLTSTGEMVGVAGWQLPTNPDVHNIFRRSAIEHYGWKDSMGWTDEEIEEMWAHVSDEHWNVSFAAVDGIRREVMGDEKHWFLAPLLTWPEYQGRGVGKRLMNWAMEQADATDPVTPMYLESSPSARAVYMHCGFVPQGTYNFVRRGPAIVKGLDTGEENVQKDKEST
ncbi:acyl-CoA N-acyltransferase [Dothidotthia symphoricarpi CBS 119687]|uniref:Acyl-CoA N-acyltransferase n=1 Tax=Dothidotthia symphoricarpi CBS 119687 TaxID=1392245 RepID=A0A6A6A2C4_9PLEO|nr:acyl-CoA N-acyltransferase [Dothidotthia symphoricarpi CBS 119687]KAF2125950.1 acyl-CoA N-acyltransferase [Dothidotthia symphoricarpi CBS 119687]